MKCLALLLVLPFLLCVTAVHASNPPVPPNPADYTVPIHVASSRTTSQCVEFVASTYCYPLLVLNVTIDGAKFEFKGAIENTSKEARFNMSDGYLMPGDYKAKLLPNKLKDPDVPYFVMKSYELLLPDGRLAQFQVTGQSE